MLVAMKAANDDVGGYRKAAPDEQGEVVIRQHYPYLALTVWSSEGFGTTRGAATPHALVQVLCRGAGYVQGDAAARHADGAYSFRGRSDEVMNVGGNRIGTEEIESAILLDRARDGSPLLNCCGGRHEGCDARHRAVRLPHSAAKAELTQIDIGRIRSTVSARVGPVAAPSRFIVVPSLPETYSGKYMRRLLAMVDDEPLGDLGALRNVDCVDPLREAVAKSAKPIASAAKAAPVAMPVQPVVAVPSVEELTKTVMTL